tara:strand:- start:424 stop:993 length:570 start_codon:yes stop_codon:yes gene_type:complete
MPKILYGGSSEPQLINLKDANYNINVLFGIIIAGFMTLLYDYGWAEVIGYSLITFSVFIIFFITMGFSNTDNIKTSNFGFIMSTFSKGFPMLLVLFLLSWIISMNIIYYDVISNNNTPREYQSYARIAAWLFILILYLLKAYAFKYINPEDSKDKVAKYSSIFIILLSSVLFWVLSIMQLILRYYITDG